MTLMGTEGISSTKIYLILKYSIQISSSFKEFDKNENRTGFGSCGN